MKQLRKTKNEREVYTDQEVLNHLRNAVTAAKRPARGEITGKRYLKIEEYTLAIVDELLDHVEQGGLSVDEMVLALAGAAALTHARGVLLMGQEEEVPLISDEPIMGLGK